MPTERGSQGSGRLRSCSSKCATTIWQWVVVKLFLRLRHHCAPPPTAHPSTQALTALPRQLVMPVGGQQVEQQVASQLLVCIVLAEAQQTTADRAGVVARQAGQPKWSERPLFVRGNRVLRMAGASQVSRAGGWDALESPRLQAVPSQARQASQAGCRQAGSWQGRSAPAPP